MTTMNSRVSTGMDPTIHGSHAIEKSFVIGRNMPNYMPYKTAALNPRNKVL